MVSRRIMHPPCVARARAARGETVETVSSKLSVDSGLETVSKADSAPIETVQEQRETVTASVEKTNEESLESKTTEPETVPPVEEEKPTEKHEEKEEAVAAPVDDLPLETEVTPVVDKDLAPEAEEATRETTTPETPEVDSPTVELPHKSSNLSSENENSSPKEISKEEISGEETDKAETEGQDSETSPQETSQVKSTKTAEELAGAKKEAASISRQSDTQSDASVFCGACVENLTFGLFTSDGE